LVNASNVAALSAELNPGAAGTLGTANVAEVSRRIEAFIAANPDQKSTNASLRVRQAVILLQNKQTNLAEAAFNEASLEDLKGSTRDQALKRLQDTLIWYHRMVGSDSIDQTAAARHYKAVTAEIDRLTPPQDEGIRDYLAAVRAWIGIKRASLTAGAAATSLLTEAINDYAKTLVPGETARWESEEQPDNPNRWPNGMKFETAITAGSRRHFRALDLIEGANGAIALNLIPIHPPAIADPYFRSRLKQPPVPPT
jgi:hypothetical protein